MDLRVQHSLQLLSGLLRATSDFARREEQLTRDFRTRRTAHVRQHSENNARQSETAASQLDEATALFLAEEDALRARHRQRGARIHQLQSSSLRQALEKARRAKEKWLNDLQLRHYQAKRALPVNLKAADDELAGFNVKLTEQCAWIGQLQARAQQAFHGYLSFARLLQRPPLEKTAVTGADRDRLAGELDTLLVRTGEDIGAFRRQPLPLLFGVLPPILLLVLVVIGAGGFAIQQGFSLPVLIKATEIAFGALALIFGLHFLGYRLAKPAATALADRLAETVRTYELCSLAAQAKHREDQARAQAEYDQISTDVQRQWAQGDDLESDHSQTARTKLNSQAPRLLARNEKAFATRLAEHQFTRATQLAEIQQRAELARREHDESRTGGTARLDEEEKAAWAALRAEWESTIQPLYAAIATFQETTQLPAWSSTLVESWTPPTQFAPATRFAQLDIDLTQQPDALPKQLPLPGEPVFHLPLALAFPEEGSLLLESAESGGAVADVLNNLVLRLLATTPPGKLAFTIIDPVGLGQNFAGLMHLSDYEESLINRRIWTQRDQIDERLGELNEHLEKVIQMYLRNEYANITEYNTQAGSVAEKYHFLVVADFPAGFTETAAKRLQSLAVSGPRCGVFTLIHWDPRQPLPDGFVADDLRQNSIWIRREASQWLLAKAEAKKVATLQFDTPPPAELAVSLVHKVGKASIDSNRVEVPFVQIAPKPEEMWTNETTSELRIPVGRTGATKLQYLAIGKGTRQHALFAGKTGSGKSTLFHVIITNLALACTPDQVEFYLIDFKKGVEFKCYASHGLPHARVVAIESDREFALSVLQRVDDELKRRGDLFRKLGVQDIPGYKRAGGTEPMPRSLLLIDEFQEFFVEDDEIAQTASLLFDRIVRQGRAFGIHVLLGSQTLGGAYTLARATLGQMVIRVALQCNEADAYLIMDDNNAAPRLLSRPGEGIYNDAAGAVEGNSPFQVVWLPDEERDCWLDQVNTLAVQHQLPRRSPIVFEGNAPANLSENDLLEAALQTPPTAAPAAARMWLGAPNSIKGPTEAVFQRQSGNHLLMVGQRDEAALAMFGVSLLSLAAQHPAGTARFYLLHQAPPGSSDAAFLDRIVAALPHPVRVAGPLEVGPLMSEISEEQQARASGDSAQNDSIFIFILGLQRFKKLRQEDEFDFSGSSDSGGNPGSQFAALITEGSNYGLHVIASVDTFNNVGRFLSRKAQSEIEMRVVFQMSANDSASLIDSPKASTLGLHRALLYNEQQGSLETFRPYALPDSTWLDHAAERLKGR